MLYKEAILCKIKKEGPLKWPDLKIDYSDEYQTKDGIISESSLSNCTVQLATEGYITITGKKRHRIFKITEAGEIHFNKYKDIPWHFSDMSIDNKILIYLLYNKGETIYHNHIETGLGSEVNRVELLKNLNSLKARDFIKVSKNQPYKYDITKNGRRNIKEKLEKRSKNEEENKKEILTDIKQFYKESFFQEFNLSDELIYRIYEMIQ